MILVTGADGFLGSFVVRRLRDRNQETVAVTHPTSPDTTSRPCDLADPSAVWRLLCETSPDCVINLAAVADFSANALPALYAVNALCPAIIARYCRERGAYLLQASMAVHGRGAACFGPDVPVTPATDYGVTKHLAEQMIGASGCCHAIIRFAGIFGRTGPAHLGINRAIRDAIAGHLPVVVGRGTGRRNYVSVQDATEQIERCVQARLTGVFYSAGETRTMGEMLQAVCDVWLPGHSPRAQAGEEACDQIVYASPELGPHRPFRQALEESR